MSWGPTVEVKLNLKARNATIKKVCMSPFPPKNAFALKFYLLTSRGQWNVTVIPNPQSLENKVSFNLHLSLLKRSLPKSWRKRKVNLVDIAQAVDKLRVMT